MSRGNRSRTPVILRIFASVLKAWWDDDALRLGASLAYYTLFAIAPVLLVATGIAGLVFNTEAVRGEIVDQLDHLVGREGARAVQSLLDGASQRRAGILATTIGSAAFVIAATGAFLELQAALNVVWRVKSNPGAHLKAFLLDRLRSFGLVVAIGFLLMISLAVTAALAAFSAWLSRHSSSLPLVWSGIQVLVSLIGTTSLFAVLYRVLPDVHLGWRDVTTGAFVTAVLFTLGQQLIGLYLGQSSMASSYGAAGSVMILLLWVYYSCQILLLGAEFTRVYAEHRGTTFDPMAFAEQGRSTQSGDTGNRLDLTQQQARTREMSASWSVVAGLFARSHTLNEQTVRRRRCASANNGQDITASRPPDKFCVPASVVLTVM